MNGSARPPLDIGIVGWHSHDEMFDAISADLKRQGHRITRWADRAAITAAVNPLDNIDLLLCVAVFPITRQILERATRLRAIVSAVTGVDGVDVAAATERGVVIGNAQTEENIIGMAEATMLMLLAALYDLNTAQRQVRQGLWRPPQLGASQLRGKDGGLRRSRPHRPRKPRGCWRRSARPCSIRPAAMLTSRACRRWCASISTPCCGPATWSWCWRASIRRRAG